MKPTYYPDFDPTADQGYEPPPDPTGLHAAIGRIVLEVDNLETAIDMAIAMLLDLESTLGDTVTSRIDFCSKLDILSGLGLRVIESGDGCCVPDALGRFEELIRKCSEAWTIGRLVIQRKWRLYRSESKFLHIEFDDPGIPDTLDEGDRRWINSAEVFLSCLTDEMERIGWIFDAEESGEDGCADL